MLLRGTHAGLCHRPGSTGIGHGVILILYHKAVLDDILEDFIDP